MCFWHIIIISIVIIIFRLNASNAVDSFLGIYMLCGLCRCLVADTHFLGQRMGQRRFSWLIEKAKPQHPSPPDPLHPSAEPIGVGVEVGQRSVANYVRFTEAKFRSGANIYRNKRHGAMSL